MKTDDYKSHNGLNLDPVECEAPNSNTHKLHYSSSRKSGSYRSTN
jgi:hypothetical protein